VPGTPGCMMLVIEVGINLAIKTNSMQCAVRSAKRSIDVGKVAEHTRLRHTCIVQKTLSQGAASKHDRLLSCGNHGAGASEQAAAGLHHSAVGFTRSASCNNADSVAASWPIKATLPFGRLPMSNPPEGHVHPPRGRLNGPMNMTLLLRLVTMCL